MMALKRWVCGILSFWGMDNYLGLGRRIECFRILFRYTVVAFGFGFYVATGLVWGYEYEDCLRMLCVPVCGFYGVSCVL